MQLALSPVPEIAISLASPEEPTPEPFSPFSQCSFLSDDQDSFRPVLLSPPPPAVVTPKQLSPLRPKDAPVTGKGLERERFEAMLQATRERNAALGSKKTTDLRKEIALKVHRTKQGAYRPLPVIPLVYVLNACCYRSRTACAVPLESAGATLAFRHLHPRHAPRVACSLPLHPAFSWSRIALGSV